MSTHRDRYARTLELLVRLLPPGRRDWGRAMQAELASIENIPGRRRFTLGCARATLLTPVAAGRLVGGLALPAIGVTALVLAAELRSAVTRIEIIVFVVVVAAFLLFARRTGSWIATGDNITARRTRAVGCAAAGLCLVSFELRQELHPGWWLAGVALACYLAAVLFVTAQGTRPAKAQGTESVTAPSAGPDPALLRAVGGMSLAATGLWWLSMLLFGVVRDHPRLALLPLSIAAAGAFILAARHRANLVKCLFTALGAASAACLFVFMISVGTYAVAPDLVPNIAGNTCCAGGLTPADRTETNRIESTDPYILVLLLGAIGSLVVVAGRRGLSGERANRATQEEAVSA